MILKTGDRIEHRYWGKGVVEGEEIIHANSYIVLFDDALGTGLLRNIVDLNVWPEDDVWILSPLERLAEAAE